MENASKALLISGGVLIAILVLTIGIALYSSTRSLGQDFEERQETIEIQKFNSIFTKFQGRDNVTAQEIVTLYNYVENYNKNNEPKIEIKVSPAILDTIEFIKSGNNNEEENIHTYRCNAIKDENEDGKYDSISFTRNL